MDDRTFPLQPPRLAWLQSHETWLGTAGLGKKVIQDFQTSTDIDHSPLKRLSISLRYMCRVKDLCPLTYPPSFPPSFSLSIPPSFPLFLSPSLKICLLSSPFLWHWRLQIRPHECSRQDFNTQLCLTLLLQIAFVLCNILT